MERDEIRRKLAEILHDRIGVEVEEVDKIPDSTSIVNDLGADPEDVSNILIDLEEEFGFEASEEDKIDETLCISDLLDFVEEKIGS